MVLGCLLSIAFFITAHGFSIGFKSGLLAGHGRMSTPLERRHALVNARRVASSIVMHKLETIGVENCSRLDQTLR